jgi:hypothetical protein
MRLVCSALFALLVLAFDTATTSEIRFSDRTTASRLRFKHENSTTSTKFLLETMGGGVVLFDYNDDGRLDVFFTNGAKLTDDMVEGNPLSKADSGFWNRLFRQEANGTFTDVTEATGLTGAAQGGYTMGAAAGDFDGDGDDDLYVTAYGGNTLYRNEGGKFVDVTAETGVRGSGWSTSAGWFDYDRDGDLDLFVARYLRWSLSDKRYCGDRKPGHRAYCHPDNFQGIGNLLYRNDGDGSFTDVSDEAGIANPAGKALGVAFADYDNDGWVDVYVANDSVQSFLYRNKGDGTFSEESLLAGAGFNDNGNTFAGMGVDFADFDNDGKPDVFITDLSNEMYVLYRNAGDGTFLYSTSTSGVGQATMHYSGWGVKFVDLDLDGWKDLFIAQGHVLDTIELTNPHLRYLQTPLVLRNTKKRFVDASARAGAAFAKAWAGRGAAFGDIDNDGDVDVIVANCGQEAYYLRNEANGSNWLGLRLIGRKSNRSAIGARVQVVSSSGQAQWATVTSAGSYLSSHDRRLLFGFGREKPAGGEIRWPSGKVQKLTDLATGRYHEITELE